MFEKLFGKVSERRAPQDRALRGRAAHKRGKCCGRAYVASTRQRRRVVRRRSRETTLVGGQDGSPGARVSVLGDGLSGLDQRVHHKRAEDDDLELKLNVMLVAANTQFMDCYRQIPARRR